MFKSENLDRCARERRKHQPKKATEALKFEAPCAAAAQNENSKVENSMRSELKFYLEL